MIVELRQDAGPEPGRRERVKRERRLRIEEAARTMFRTKGFEATSTREIAAAAGLGAGTLYAYAPSKLALLRMVYRRELEAITHASFASLPDAPVLDQLVHVFRARLVFWGADPPLSRHANIATFTAQYDAAGMPDDERLEQSLRDALVAFVHAAQRAGRLARGDDPVLIARVVLDVYLTECREWIAEAEPQLEPVVLRLRAALEVALRAVLVVPERDRRVHDLDDAVRDLSPEDVAEVVRFARFRAADQRRAR